MAFVQKAWKDRVSEYISRRILTKEDGTTELVTVERSEGTVSQEGDAFSADNMNDLEQRIADEFSEQNKKMAGEEFGYDENGDFCHRQVGADTWLPFINDDMVSTKWELLSKVESTCPDRDADAISSYAVTEDGKYVAIFAAGGNGAAQRGHVFSATGTTLAEYQSHTSSGYVCLVHIKFIKAEAGDTISYAFPKQNESRGTFMLFKISE